jgi:hypothetical protein
MAGALRQPRKLQATQPPDNPQKNHAMIYSDSDYAAGIVIHGKGLALLVIKQSS